ncbi:sensor histidine kinase [Archangium lipolyticum]|uniref:sensor histidine kinase n=1 Tax=Archangium lipolyticum TaxID=2970465 RepID=UPI00214A273C|nr:ATP-binding protein [Archangium lipolyticum]
MTVRARILLFASVAVGLVVVLGGTVSALSLRGIRSTEQIFAMQDQQTLYGRLTGDEVSVPHALIDARERGQELGEVLAREERRAEADFAQLRELVRREVDPEALPEELARIEAVRTAHLGWMRRTEARVREAPAGAVDRGLHGTLDAFQAEVKPHLEKAWEAKRAQVARHKYARLKTLGFTRFLGLVIPLVALVVVFALAATILVALHRSSRELLRGAERIGRGDFTTELPVRGQDEYSMLARAFNRMAAELRDTVRQKEWLAKAEAESSQREMRHYNALLEETVRQRTAELEEANGQLLFADRLATVGQLAASVGHEINNPLAFILGNLGYVREELGRLQGTVSVREREELLEALAEAQEGAERVRLLVQDLKLLSRADDAGSEVVDLGAVLRSASKMAAHEIRLRARLVMQSEGVPQVHGNAARLCQVFLNLLLNAAHAITPGAVERNEIRLIARRGEGSRVLVEVSDTGCGIPPENLERIFRPFFTTKPAGVGSGLGLSVCHRIITAHGGELTVESEQGRGTTFRVSLPVHAAGQPLAPGPLVA